MIDSPTYTSGEGEAPRRDFLLIATSGLGIAGLGLAAWPFIDSINPAKDVLALSSTEVDLSAVDVGMAITVMWRGKPVFIRRRTEHEIKIAEDVNIDDLRDPQTDDERTQQKEWLIVIGVCTHLGCIPAGQNLGDNRGDFGGWYCPCHGSHYDTAGRIRKGPAPYNLFLPPYTFMDDHMIKIG